MRKVCIVGVGPGSKDYLFPLSLKRIRQADVLIGAERHLSLFRGLNKENICLKNNFTDIITYVRKNRDKKNVVILVSGDPGLYSLLAYLRKSFTSAQIEVIPGISALQVAFARIGEPWQDARIVSLHGRNFADLAEIARRHGKVFLFTDDKLSPAAISRYLLGKGIKKRRVIVFEKLSYPQERIIDTDLKSLSSMSGFDLCVMIIEKIKQ